jgi:hypothetical protein
LLMTSLSVGLLARQDYTRPTTGHTTLLHGIIESIILVHPLLRCSVFLSPLAGAIAPFALPLPVVML